MKKTETNRYLSSMVNFLSVTEAVAKHKVGWEVWIEDNGTWSAVWLVNKPVQPGQVPWAMDHPNPNFNNH